ncbi:hypothetical protein F4861DRAFT_456559 [Xylaria intraflava]|nr:hypothetical protein F4861DRAFT_456559 [Xylaria intraflava]
MAWYGDTSYFRYIVDILCGLCKCERSWLLRLGLAGLHAVCLNACAVYVCLSVCLSEDGATRDVGTSPSTTFTGCPGGAGWAGISIYATDYMRSRGIRIARTTLNMLRWDACRSVSGDSWVWSVGFFFVIRYTVCIYGMYSVCRVGYLRIHRLKICSTLFVINRSVVFLEDGFSDNKKGIEICKSEPLRYLRWVCPESWLSCCSPPNLVAASPFFPLFLPFGWRLFFFFHATGLPMYVQATCSAPLMQGGREPTAQRAVRSGFAVRFALGKLCA